MTTHRPRRLGIAVVRGRSMEPTLHEGDRLLVRYGVLPRAGRLALVVLPDPSGPVTAVKRLETRAEDGWWFSRDNPREGVDSWTLGRPSATSDVLAVVLARLWPRPRPLRAPASGSTGRAR